MREKLPTGSPPRFHEGAALADLKIRKRPAAKDMVRSLTMKEMIVGTSVGSLAQTARNVVQLLRAAYRSPESIGTLANDQLATSLITGLCLPSKGFIDVGAHIGSVMSAVIRRDPSIKVYAFEPIKEKADSLRRRFPTVELHQCALGETDGEATFFVNMERSGYSSLGRPTISKGVTEIKVPLRKLDTLISSRDVDALKIDVEGAELGVLRGGGDLIARNRPLIMFESGPTSDDGLGYSKESMWQWLAERNFEIVLPNRVAHNGPGLTLDGFIEAHFYPFRTLNYFAIPNERRIEIRDRARCLLKILIA